MENHKDLIKKALLDPNTSDDLVIKAMKKEGMVQKEIQVKGKTGVYTRKQWVRASDVNKDKSSKKSSKPKKGKGSKKSPLNLKDSKKKMKEEIKESAELGALKPGGNGYMTPEVYAQDFMASNGNGLSETDQEKLKEHANKVYKDLGIPETEGTGMEAGHFEVGERVESVYHGKEGTVTKVNPEKDLVSVEFDDGKKGVVDGNDLNRLDADLELTEMEELTKPVTEVDPSNMSVKDLRSKLFEVEDQDVPASTLGINTELSVRKLRRELFDLHNEDKNAQEAIDSLEEPNPYGLRDEEKKALDKYKEKEGLEYEFSTGESGATQIMVSQNGETFAQLSLFNTEVEVKNLMTGAEKGYKTVGTALGGLIKQKEGQDAAEYLFGEKAAKEKREEIDQMFNEAQFEMLREKDKSEALEYLKNVGVEWKENDHPGVNWMRAISALKKQSSQEPPTKSSKKQESSPDKAEAKKRLKSLVDSKGKDKVMELAKQNGITWNEADHSGVNWMRANMAITKELKNNPDAMSGESKSQPKPEKATPKKATPEKATPKKETLKPFREKFGHLENSDFQNRGGGYPKSGIPDSIEVVTNMESDTHGVIYGSFKNTGEEAAKAYMENYVKQKLGKDLKNYTVTVTAEQSGDYHNDWVDARVDVEPK